MNKLSIPAFRLALFFAVFFSFNFFSFSTAWGSECVQCGERKLLFCAKECALVPISKVKTCQRDCLHEYCAHKCGLSKEDPQRSYELESLFSTSCEKCREEQFSRCEGECPSGTEYQQAKCKLNCAETDCIRECTPE